MFLHGKSSLHPLFIDSGNSSSYRLVDAISHRSSRRLRRLILSAVVFLTFLICLYPWSRLRECPLIEPDQQPAKNRLRNATEGQRERGFFHLVIPANHYDLNLCKTLLSASILGYPSPTLVNWGETYESADILAGGSHAAKLNGVLKYLKELDDSHDQDLVLIVDAYDVWFQLGPKILIDRYHAINRAANLRFGGQLCDDSGLEHASQKVLFSSQKDCWPGNDSYDMSCYAVPESPLPSDTFGQGSEAVGDEHEIEISRRRPRFLNSGTVMGPVGTLRAIYEVAARQWDANPSFLGSDQAILADVFGKQEYKRAYARHQQVPFWVRVAQWLTRHSRQQSGKYEVIDPHPTRQTPDLYSGTRSEFGIGLDYASALAQATIFSEKDSAWIRFSQNDEIIRAAAYFNIGTIRATSLATDIAQLMPPFSTEAAALDDDVPQPTWQDVPLYTNLWTGITPAIIHHNAWDHDMKKVRETAWDQMWFQPYAREMLQARFNEQQTRLENQYSDGKLVAVDKWGKSWWSAIDANLGKGEILRPPNTWESICPAEFHEEIFRDGLGLLRSGTSPSKRSERRKS